MISIHYCLPPGDPDGPADAAPHGTTQTMRERTPEARGRARPTFDSKPFFQRRLRPVANAFARAGITANQVTLTSLVLALGAGATVAVRPTAGWPLLLVPAVLLVRLAFNHIDGLLAREHGMATPLGGFLNELVDVVADAALYLPLAAVPGVSPWLVVPAVLLGVIVEMTGVVAVTLGAERRNDGPMAKKPRGTLFGGIALALGLGAAPGPWLDVLLAAALPLLALTIGNRMAQALRQGA